MRLLVLGGTKFLGRAVVEGALARGHEVTLFNRGRTNPELFPEAEKLLGDRDDPRTLCMLEGREWDAVIDPSGFVPRVVRASTELLRGSVGHYVFVSSASVYAEPYVPGFDETAPTVQLEDPASEEVERDYGGLKAACEQVVREVFPDAHTNVRAGLIVGPHDPTGRFTYWPLRMSLGGEALAPLERAVQFVDARDLGAWMVEACERRISGTFNATSEPMRFAELLAACGDAEPVWVDEQFLLEHGVEPWREPPLWLPGPDAHFLEMGVAKAVAAGLCFRPLEETVRDTLAWARESGEQLVTSRPLRQGGAGLDPARESELLQAWRRRGVTLAQ